MWHFIKKYIFIQINKKRSEKRCFSFQIFRILFTSEGVANTVFQNRHTRYRAIFSNYDI